MKRVYLILTLFMTSFFFISLNEVRADTYNYIISNTDLSYLNDYFLSFREKVINYCNENNLYYYIASRSTSKQVFDAYISAEKPYITLGFQNSLDIKITNSMRYTNLSNGNYDNFVVVESTTSSFSHNILWQNQFLFDRFLDSNSPDLINLNPNTFNVTYNDKTYLIESNSNILPLYSIYQDYHKPADPFEESKGILNEFYSTVILKIQELAVNFTNNYAFILIFGIFIFIFVFELIRRRFI